MQVQIFKALWGMPEPAEVPYERQLARIRAAGYDGVESPIPDCSATQWRELLAKSGLQWIAQIFPVTSDDFRRDVERARGYSPLKINCHDGRDSMSRDEGRAYFRAALEVEADAGLEVVHETHRHRLFYAPWTTADYLAEFPALKITADFSHWCVVTESLLKEIPDLVTAAIARARHIHGRVGFEEGAQVNDPRAPENAHYVAAHEAWWDAIKAARERDGTPLLTFNPEYGPYGYMHVLPYTMQPVCDLWDVCLWSAERLRTRWKLKPPAVAAPTGPRA